MESMGIYFVVRIVYVLINIESVGCIVSADFFVGFYIHFYVNDILTIHCHSPPVSTSFEIRVDWRFLYG